MNHEIMWMYQNGIIEDIHMEIFCQNATNKNTIFVMKGNSVTQNKIIRYTIHI